VVGPCLSIAEALAAARCGQIDAAVLDINIDGSRSDAVATELQQRGVPFVFATGYAESGFSFAWDAPVIDKPFTERSLAAAVAQVLLLAAPKTR
jgi:CheY-like chemotaxis protein